ncbi:hypothetical protein [Flavobacterium phycosphaerae]|nr:hypothetical protein [Flavobacterium phycosphaerae]
MKQHPKRDDIWQITINFSSYSSLYATVSDLMKLCCVAWQTEEPYISDTVGNPNIDFANIIELALQLMPKGESEFLDEVHRIKLNVDDKPEPIPEYNYSTTTILQSSA